jgi:VanZ family protein
MRREKKLNNDLKAARQQMMIYPKINSILFRLFLIVFIVLYFFLPTGFNLHRMQFLHLPCDYLGHALSCFILFVLFINSSDFLKGTNNAGSIFLKLLVMALAVTSLEFIQRFVPERSFDWFDILSNLCGIATGTVVGLWMRRRCEVRGAMNNEE